MNHEVVGRETVYQQGSFSQVVEHVKGAHPQEGVINLHGYTGVETMIKRDVVRPVVTVTVEPTVESAFFDFYGLPLSCSEFLAGMDNELGQEHRNRIEGFKHMVQGVIYDRSK